MFIPLFEHYLLLGNKLPYVSLGEFPTPVEKLDRLGGDIGLDHLYIKRDDLSGRVYGGNKVRKLELLLGYALRVGVKEVLALGCVGSNYALATAIYAQQLGLKSISMLMPQPNAQYVRRNLLMSYYCRAELHQHRNIPLLYAGIFHQFLWHKLKYRRSPQIMPLGGSSPLGVTGFVNAAFELKEQIMEGEMPEPDCIYVALGSMGTAVGLMLGLRAAHLRSRVICVQVAGEKSANEKRMVKLFHKTGSFLCSLDPSFPELELSEKDIEIKRDFLGQGYAFFTEEGMEAMARIEETEGINLEGTYTGKTFAALIDDAEKQNLRDKVVLFWNTYNSRSFSDVIDNVDYHQLPRSFHRYFEEEVQPLDR